MIQKILDSAGDISTIQWLIALLVSGVVYTLILWRFGSWLVLRQWRLFKNLKRQLIVIKPQSVSGSTMDDLSSELRLLQRSGLFKIPTQAIGFKDFDPSNDQCVVVLGYKEGMDGLDEVLTKVKHRHIPLLVYTYGLPLPSADKKKIDSYPMALCANFRITLVNSIFATVASYPYESH